MDRLERLVNLVAALIDTPQPLTRQQIHERIEGYSDDPDAFRRNFERDKELLRQMGLPLSTEPLDPSHPDEVGYRIPREEYELPDPGLDEDELAALRLAAAAVQLDGAWGRDASVRALRKLAGATTGDTASTGTADQPEPAGAPGPDPGAAGLAALPGGDLVAAAFGAIAARRRVRFTYRQEDRVVDPWRLSYRRGQWYLAGLDHTRGEERLFRLDRIAGALRVEGPPGAFARPAPGAAGPAPPWRFGDEEEIRAELLVDADQVQWAVDALGADAISSRRPDGSVVFEVGVTEVAAFRSFVLGFLDHAEILGPPDLRRDMVAWLARLAQPAVATADGTASTPSPSRGTGRG
jgi:predicted DNA-binding transcriptional regulator YafY